ncbi:Eukaryotic translation initiation factor 2D [Toxocara canis]|uniref:Eukaryotic translation initiation factor 2D n=1 Tax=Toxocara canis TaxID=6265 RepID=A0A0B2VID7_TOXCA|nr:Eukaryotic translation initiation factor 2D [Toxocara canis]
MFRKPFVVKSNTNMRSSDRRKLLSRLQCADALSPKAQIALVKLISNNDMHINVYTFDKNPLLFEIEDDPNLYPTVPAAVATKPLSDEDFPALGELVVADEGKTETEEHLEAEASATAVDATENEQVEQRKPELEPEPETMEDLLRRCFLAALKYRVGKKTELPLDVGEFYSRFLLACVPSTKRIDMKKTKFKKFTVFLSDINSSSDGPVVKVTSKGKGADAIAEGLAEKNVVSLRDEVLSAVVKHNTETVDWNTLIQKIMSRMTKTFVIVTADGREMIRKMELPKIVFKINWSHRLLVEFERKDEVTEDSQPAAKPCIRIDEYFAITEPVLPLFRIAAGLSKGDLIETPRVREIITSYVKNRVKIAFVNHIFISIFVFVYESAVETRSGNKKVTLVNNLSVYGIECKSFCQQVQVGIATSANMVNDAGGCEGPQVIIQGNQVQFASELLSSEYGIDKKYMSGLDLIPKKKR